MVGLMLEVDPSPCQKINLERYYVMICSPTKPVGNCIYFNLHLPSCYGATIFPVELRTGNCPLLVGLLPSLDNFHSSRTALVVIYHYPETIAEILVTLIRRAPKNMLAMVQEP